MSYEAVFTFGVILLIFVIILSVLTSRETDRSSTQDFLENRRECLKLSNEISAVYSLGDKATSSLRLLKPANVTGDIIKVGNFLCNACCNFTNGTLTSFNIPSGIVSLQNEKGSIKTISETSGGGGSQTQNTTIFYDGFETWGSGHCMHNGLWSLCNRGDGHLESHPHDYHNGTRALELDSHNADIDYLIKCVDLTTYTKAYTKFWWKKGGLEPGEYGKLDVNTTTMGFVEIFTSGSGSSSYAQKTIDISAYKSSSTCLKFHALANGNSDNFFVDDFRIIGES